MQWSKLKTKIKELIYPELQNRIDFFVTSYRKSHDGSDKIWLTIDGEKVFECKYYVHERAEADAHYSGLRTDEIKDFLGKQEIYSPQNLGDSMREYLKMPIKEALNSDNPFIKAFAILDRRTGKRTLAEINVSETDHSLVKEFYKLRRSSETS